MKIVLFLDVGVLSIPNRQNTEERKERWPGCGVLWPIPLANALLQAIDTDPRILPVWLSCWDSAAWHWNDRAGTSRWAVGYHLCKTVQTKALQRFPECRGQDKKLLAARWFLRERPHNQVVWIEDGFAEETKAWASARGRTRLVDTWPMAHGAAAFLARRYQNEQRAAQIFLARYCGIQPVEKRSYERAATNSASITLSSGV